MFNYTIPKGKRTGFQCDIDTIRRYLCDIGNTWLLIAYRVYEISVNKSYSSAGYRNIVEACEKELGFKKSTTYNLINVVKSYGKDKNGIITYNQLTSYGQYTYSQLVEMLSLGTAQRAEVKPDTPVSAIRMLKRSSAKEKLEVFQPSEEISSAAFQTSGKSDVVDRSEVLENISFTAPDISADFQFSIGRDPDLYVEFNNDFLHYFDSFTSDLCDLYYTFTPYLLEADVDMFDPNDLEKRFNYILHVYRSAYNAVKKQQNIKDKTAV